MGITRGGNCRRDRRWRALAPALSPLVSSAVSSPGNAHSRSLLQSCFLSPPVMPREGKPGEIGLPNVGTRGI